MLTPTDEQLREGIRGHADRVDRYRGGTITPDTIVFTLAFNTYFGVERPFYQLAHNLVLTSPVGPYLRRFGTVAASHENARKALDAGAARLVYPGGDGEGNRVGGRLNLWLGGQQLVEPLRGAGGAEQVAIDFGQGAERAREQPAVKDEGGDGAARNPARCDRSSSYTSSSPSFRYRNRHVIVGSSRLHSSGISSTVASAGGVSRTSLCRLVPGIQTTPAWFVFHGVSRLRDWTTCGLTSSSVPPFRRMKRSALKSVVSCQAADAASQRSVHLRSRTPGVFSFSRASSSALYRSPGAASRWA